MQPRLTRSRTEVVVAGVCGGLAEYFHIDPLIVRMIFVLVTITSGLGIIVYPVLWIVMPQGVAAPDAAQPPLVAPQGQSFLQGQNTQPETQWEPEAVRLHEPARHSGARSATPPPFADQPPPPEAYIFNPLTGERIGNEGPSTGATVDLSRDPAALAAAQQVAPAAEPQLAPPAEQPTGRRRISWAGVVLLGIGVMMLADRIGIDPDIMFPILMVAVGAFLLLRRA